MAHGLATPLTGFRMQFRFNTDI